MKRIFAAVLIFCFCLGGCDTSSDYTEPDERLIITALGIDCDGDNFALTAELEDNTTIFGDGKSITAAAAEMSGRAAGKLMLSKCPVIIIDADASDKDLEEIYDFCVRQYEISLSARPVCCDSASDLIYSGTDGAVGFALLDILELGNDENGVTSGQSFVDILNLRQKSGGTYYMPHISSNNSRISVDGISYYSSDRLLFTLSLTDAQLLSALNGKLKSCKIILGETVLQILSTAVSETSRGRTVHFTLNQRTPPDTEMLSALILSHFDRLLADAKVKKYTGETGEIKVTISNEAG